MNGKVITNPDRLVKRLTRISKSAEHKWYLGKLDDTLRLLEQGENLLENFPGELSKEMKQLYSGLLAQKAVASSFQRNMHRSLEWANDALKIAEEIDDKYSLSRAIYAFGASYFFSGDLEQALKHFDRCIELTLEFVDVKNKPQFLADPLWAASRTAVDKGDVERAKEYFKQLEELNEQNKIQYHLINQCYLVVKALILKVSSRFRDRGMAEEYLKEIVENELIHATFRFFSLVDLCELLLNELHITNDVTIVNEIKLFVSKLMNIGQNRNYYYYLIKSYILRGKIALITFEMKEARRYFMQAQRIAERQGYNKMSLEIASLHEELMQQLEVWDYLKEINAPISKRMELARLSGDLNDFFRARMATTAQVSEKRVTVYKERKKCLVCMGEIEGFDNYICPQCDSIYCKNCAKALIELENACWSCEFPINKARPVKTLKQEEDSVDTIEKKDKKGKK